MTPSAAQVERARYIRTILGYHDHNQTHLGRLLGITQQAAGRKLRGQSRFSVEQLLIIADAYGIDHGLLLKPPPLENVLGCVRQTAGTLLTCTYNAFPQVRGYVLPAVRPGMNSPPMNALAVEPQAA